MQKNTCKSITHDDQQCKNKRAWFSQYCWHHRETSWLFALIIGLLSNAFFFWLGLSLVRAPNLSAACFPNEAGLPTELICEVENTGKGAANDVVLSFNKMLPAGTQVKAKPEISAFLRKVDKPPDPNTEYSFYEKAFAIHINRVPPQKTVKIYLSTVAPDNLRAGNQILKIRKEIFTILNAFGERLEKAHPSEAEKWVLKDVISERIKSENFFVPGLISYDLGEREIKYFASNELIARTINQELYSKYKKEFIDIYQTGKSFLAAVIKIESGDSTTTFVTFPPYIKTCNLISFVMPERDAKMMPIPPQIPSDYNLDVCPSVKKGLPNRQPHGV